MPFRRNPGVRFGLFAGIAICLSLPASAWGATTGAASSCPDEEIRTASGCATFAEAGREVRSIVRQVVEEDDLNAALVRVDVGNRTLATATPGESIAGVPATPRMNFRIGANAIPDVVDLLLQLQDRGALSLDDPVGEWLPNLPNADRVTLRMLASSTSGYPDWIQGNPQFQEELLADVFRRWTTSELLGVAFAQPLICGPGECFHYAHTNFAILGKVIHQVTGRPVEKLLRRRVLEPLRLRHTEISGLPDIPKPVLHTYTADRGPYEDSTYWSPSYGLPKSMLMTATIADLIKSAKATGTGALVSQKASRARFEPITAGLPGVPGPQFDQDFYFGLGVLVLNSWQFQNPEINGYKSISAYLPSRRISLAITSTEGPTAAKAGNNFSAQLFNDIALYLTPGHPAVPAG
jgi:CubicO group peptidase (beta-lactamase class C family)